MIISISGTGILSRHEIQEKLVASLRNSFAAHVARGRGKMPLGHWPSPEAIDLARKQVDALVPKFRG